MTDPEIKETLVKQEPRVNIDRKESVKGDVSWNIGIGAPLTDDLDKLINQIAEARKHAYKKDAEIRAFKLELLPKKEDLK